MIVQAVEALGKPDSEKQNLRVLWLGNAPDLEVVTKTKKGRTFHNAVLTFTEKTEEYEIRTSPEVGQWLHIWLTRLSEDLSTKFLLKDLAADYPEGQPFTFLEFLITDTWLELRERGLLVV